MSKLKKLENLFGYSSYLWEPISVQQRIDLIYVPKFVLSLEKLKCGFCKKLLLYNRTPDQLPTFFILSSLLGGCNSKATANPPKSDDRMKKVGNWSELDL